MKKLAKYLKDYIRQDFNAGLYIVLAVFITAMFILNYKYGLRAELLDKYFYSNQLYLNFFLFFGFTYYLVLFIECLFRRDFSVFRSKKFMLFSLAGLIILTIDGSVYSILYKLAQYLDNSGYYYQWYYLVFSNLKRILVLGLLLYIFKMLFDRNAGSFYGLTKKNFDAKAYFQVLLLVLPLIAWAATRESFMVRYPIYKPGTAEISGGVPYFFTIGIFEVLYGSRFIAVELFFRGFLIVGLARFIGPRALWPMVVAYASWHFGKPMPEAIGAIFGGYALGVFAMRTGTVLGGVVIHMGVALSMEAAALLRQYVF